MHGLRELSIQIDAIIADALADTKGRCIQRAALLHRVMLGRGHDARLIAGASEILTTTAVMRFFDDDLQPDIASTTFHCAVRIGDLIIDISTIEYDGLPEYLTYDYHAAALWRYAYRFIEDADITASVNSDCLHDADLDRAYQRLTALI